MEDASDDPGTTGSDDEQRDSTGELEPGRPLEDQRQSPLAGFMSVPVHPRVPLRRSTVLMALAFAGSATLLALYPPESTAPRRRAR